MGIIDRIRNFAATCGGYGKGEVYDDEAYEEDSEAEDGEDEVVGYRPDKDRASEYRSEYRTEHRSSRGEGRMKLPPLSSKSSAYYARGSKVVDMNALKAQVVIASPKSIEEAGLICDYLLEGRIVTLNFESVDHNVSQRIVDFLSGAAYSLGGSIHGTGNLTFIVAPSHVDITGELRDELRSGGTFFSYKSAAR